MKDILESQIRSGYHKDASAELAVQSAFAELANKKIDEAEKRLEDLLGFDSGDSRILALYARLSQLKNDTQNALRYYQLSVQHEEEMAFSHFEMARYYFQFGMQSKALTEIDKCLLLLPFENSMRRAVEELKKNILSEKETKNAQE